MINERKSGKDNVGIVTLYHGNYNFGGLLQAYALPTALEKYIGIPAEQIDYVSSSGEEHRIKDSASIGKIIYKAGILFFSKLEKNNLEKRRKVFEQFMMDIPHSNRVYEYDTVSESLKTYKKIICGGDQIWSDYQQTKWFSNADLRVFTLQFVPKQVKKISYAPSVAVLELTDEFKREFSKGINSFDAISVREKRSLSVLRQVTDNPVKVVVDPVLLLKESDWLQVMNYSQKKEKYILCYLLGDSIEQRKAVKKFAEKLNCKIIIFPHILQNAVRKSDLFFGDIRDYSSGPREFLGLIKNAEVVITDSFHACVFSMIFQTALVVFERGKIGGKVDINSRIYDFLEEYHLEGQLVTEKELTDMKEIPKIDYTYAHEHWKKRRQESLQYLEEALKDN